MKWITRVLAASSKRGRIHWLWGHYIIVKVKRKKNLKATMLTLHPSFHTGEDDVKILSERSWECWESQITSKICPSGSVQEHSYAGFGDPKFLKIQPEGPGCHPHIGSVGSWTKGKYICSLGLFVWWCWYGEAGDSVFGCKVHFNALLLLIFIWFLQFIEIGVSSLNSTCSI